MLVILAKMKAKPAHKTELVATMVEDARVTEAEEPRCLRFDVIQDRR